MKKFTALLAAGLVFGASGMAMAATASGTMSASAELVASCTVSDSALSFSNSDALLSGSDKIADTGTTLKVACTTGTSPLIWSSSPRLLANGLDSFAFNLSQTAGALNDDLPAETGGAEAIAGYSADGSEITVPLYGKILRANFGNKPAKIYTASITVNVNY